MKRENQEGGLMKRHLLVISAFALAAAPCNAEVLKSWSFDKHNDREGWSTPPQVIGAVMGGSVWISIRPASTDPATVSSAEGQISGNCHLDQVSRPKANGWEPYKEPKINMLQSPQGLAISAAESNLISVRVRILNLSPITDLFARWKTKDESGQYSGQRRCPMRAELKEWQELTCFFDGKWQGVVDRISLAIPQSVMRGDLWIDKIEIGTGIPEPTLPRPDLASAQVVPRIDIPHLSQSGFADAFKVMDETLIVDVPLYGFTHPVNTPGAYEENWWTMDSSMALKGAKWSDQKFAENVLRGFRDVQAPDGRVPDRGYAGVRGQVGDFTQIPRIFEAAYDVARRSTDSGLRNEVYEMMHRYLDWWLSPVKRDRRTGLISGVGEETFNEHDPFSYAPQSRAHVDTNIAVAVGARMTADLADLLGQEEESRKYRQSFRDVAKAINTYLWDEEDGAYYNFDLKSSRRMPRLMLSTLNPLQFAIAPADRRQRLEQLLLNPKIFNWGNGPLSGLAMTEPDFKDAFAKGEFSYANSTAAWFGDATTFGNVPVIKGLQDSGRPDLAAELNWAMIKAFHGNYAEHLFPTSNRGDGAKRYTWSAAEYIEAVIDRLFGVDFSALEKRVRIAPHVPKALYARELALNDLILPTGGDTRLSVHVNQQSVRVAQVSLLISGDLPEGNLEITLPGSGETFTVPMQRSYIANFR